MKTYTGKMASGKRVYVRDQKPTGNSRLKFAIYAVTSGNSKLTLVGKVRDEHVRKMICHNGLEHQDGVCHWAYPGGAGSGITISASEEAAWRAHWWRYVVNTTAEIVELKPVGEP